MAGRETFVCTCTACVEHPRGAVASAHRKINRAIAGLDEKQARRVLGLMAEREGHGGVASLSRITGMSRTTIAQGRRELAGTDPVPEGRVRRPGGGRKSLEKKGPS